MRFYTKLESDEWLQARSLKLPLVASESLRVDYQSENRRMAFYAHWLASHLPQRSPTLLLLTECGVWPSSENWHLYYKLRQSYSDVRLLHEAPGHLFLEHEVEDLASFLQLAMMNGWGGYVLSGITSLNAFFSHDEYIDFFATKKEQLLAVREVMR